MSSTSDTAIRNNNTSSIPENNLLDSCLKHLTAQVGDLLTSDEQLHNAVGVLVHCVQLRVLDQWRHDVTQLNVVTKPVGVTLGALPPSAVLPPLLAWLHAFGQKTPDDLHQNTVAVILLEDVQQDFTPTEGINERLEHLALLSLNEAHHDVRGVSVHGKESLK